MSKNISVHFTSCCGVADIDGLSYGQSAETSMLEICQDLACDGDGRDLDANLTGAHYLFTAVIQEGRTRYTYGPDFKAYILKHKLGTVTQSPVRANRGNHPDHWIRAYLWQPNVRSLKAWYKKHKEDDR